MSEQEAQAEAERRYPKRPFVVESHVQNSFIAGAEWLASRRVVAAPSDTDREEQAERIVTKHLSWLSKRDDWAEDDTAIGGQGANIVRQLSEAGLLSQPVQVEVTDEMVERAAVAFGGLTVTDLSSAQEWERKAVHDSMRAALEAALGGGDHAE